MWYHAQIARLMIRGEAPLQNLGRLFGGWSEPIRGEPGSLAIPKQMFVTWQRPWITKSCFRNWQRMVGENPGWRFYFFDDAALDRYMAEHWGGHPIERVFRKATLYPLKTDIWRYCVLFDYGGVYSDVKSTFLRPLDISFGGGRGAVLAMEPHEIDAACLPRVLQLEASKQALDRWLLNYLLAFPPQHPILKILLEQIVSEAQSYSGRMIENPKSHVLNLTGPRALTRACLEYLVCEGHALVIDGVEYQYSAKYMPEGSIHIYRSMKPPAKHYSRLGSAMMLSASDCSQSE